MARSRIIPHASSQGFSRQTLRLRIHRVIATIRKRFLHRSYQVFSVGSCEYGSSLVGAANLGSAGINYETGSFAKLWMERGIEGCIEEVQKTALVTKPMTDGFERPSYIGSYLYDVFWNTIAVRDFGESVGGKIGEKIGEKRIR